MVVSEMRLYDILKNKLGEKEAETFMEVLEETAQRKVDLAKSNLAIKEDLQQAKIDSIKWVFAFWVTLMLMIVALYLKGS